MVHVLICTELAEHVGWGGGGGGGVSCKNEQNPEKSGSLSCKKFFFRLVSM